MDFAKEVLDSIEIMVKKAIDDETTKIYTGICQSANSNGTCVILVNDKTNTVKFYGGTPKYNEAYRVFVPGGNMSAAFIIVPGEAEETSSEITSYTQLTDLPSINNIPLLGNKTSTDLGLYGTNNPPKYPVTSVNELTGDVVITASDIGALPNTTVIPTKTSELTNDSGFVTEGTLTGYAKEEDIPTKTSQLSNDSGYITNSALAPYAKKADIPTVNNPTLIIQRNSATVGTFSANDAIDKTINISVPTTASEVGADVAGAANAVLGSSSDDSGKATVYGARALAQEAIDAVDNIKVAEYNIIKDVSPESGFLSTYHLTKDGVNVGVAINIPKDYLVKSAEVKESTGTSDPSGFPVGTKYIDFVVNTYTGSGNESHIYLNVEDLVDTYVAGNGITITAENVISANVISINNKTGNVNLTANDVGALPNTTVIPIVNDATLTVQKNGVAVGTFTANASSNKSINITVPTKTSDLTNNSGYITSVGAPVQSVNTKTGAVVLTQDDIGDGTTYVRTHNDFTDALKQQINTNEDNIAMIDSDVGALETDVSKAKTDIASLQTALQSKQNTVTGAGSTITENNLTANRALISNSSGKVAVSDITATELGYLDGATSNIQSQINNKANTSVLPNNSDIMQTKFRIAKQGYTGSAPQYYRLVKFPINNSGNYASAIISGRIGGWANDGISYINAVAWNRGYPGIALFSAMASNNVSQPWSYCDLIIYTEEDNSATLYLKTNSYYTFDVDVEVYQAGCDIIYDGTPIDVPTGTAIAYASSSYKRAEISQGKLYIAGNEAALLSNIPTQLSDLNNDVGFITANDIPVKSVNNKTGDVTLSAADVGALSTAGGTLTGNLTGKYLTGTWLQTTSTSNLNAIPNKYAVIDGSGWIYYRTKDEMISDLGIDSGGAVQSVNGKTGEVVLTASDVGAVSTSNVTQTLGSSTDKVPSEKAVANAIASAGGGDMTKAVYDPTGAVANAGGIVAYSDNKMDKVDPVGSGKFSFGRASGSVEGQRSIVFGSDTIASGKDAISIGRKSNVSADYGTALGHSNEVGGGNGIGIGVYNRVTADNAIAIGGSNTAEEWTSVAIGVNNTSSGNGSVAIGTYSTASGVYSVATGVGNIASGGAQFVAGSYNLPDTLPEGAMKSTNLVIIGNGDFELGPPIQSNAMTLDWQGNGWFAGDVYVGSTSGTNKDDGSKKLITADDAPVKSVNGKTGAVSLTASDVKALPLTGGELSGNIKIKNPNNAYYELNDGTTRWFLQCYEGNCGMGPSWAKATVWDPNGNMTINGNVDVQNHKISNVATPTADNDAVNKAYITKANVGLGNVDNVKQYSASNPPPYPVASVNGKTGAITLSASDVGALPNTTVIPTVNDATLTIQKNGTSVGTFTANASSNKTVNIAVPTNNNELTNGAGYITNSALTPYAKTADIPTKTSDLTNNSGFITASGAPVQSVDGATGAIVLNDVKFTTQTLTDAQKTQARTNIGAGTSSFSGNYNDLSNKPTIPTVNNGVLTIQKNGTTVNTFTANSSANVTANITVPTNNNELTNGAGYITNAALSPYAKSADVPTKVSDLTNDKKFVTIVTQAEQPTGQSVGDFWYEVT